MMMMMTLRLLVVVVVVVVVGVISADKGHGLNIDDIRNMVNALEESLNQVDSDLSEGNTLVGVGGEKINCIANSFLSSINLQNSQQDKLIEKYAKQIKDLQHRADGVEEQTAGVQKLAEATRSSSRDQLDLVNQIIGDDVDQEAAINDLRDDLNEAESDSFLRLVNKLLEVNNQNTPVSRAIDDLQEFIDSRKCEYGTVVLDANRQEASSFFHFKTNFTSVPEVSLSLTGYAAHLDSFDLNHYDRLGVEKSLGEVTMQGFNVNTQDLSQGVADVKVVYCSFMACQAMNGNWPTFG